jgi:hypothetical protein
VPPLTLDDTVPLTLDVALPLAVGVPDGVPLTLGVPDEVPLPLGVPDGVPLTLGVPVGESPLEREDVADIVPLTVQVPVTEGVPDPEICEEETSTRQRNKRTDNSRREEKNICKVHTTQNEKPLDGIDSTKI